MALTSLQGQYIAFIHQYTALHRRPPAERDIQAYFRTSPPAVHDMILRLESLGVLARTPGEARSLRVTLPATEIPPLA
ncbi:MAG: MarR family transcriptional regulator [Anaerolinea sp.]|nr:MarR family transcriptional regulator [Anaerolinea sp.]